MQMAAQPTDISFSSHRNTSSYSLLQIVPHSTYSCSSHYKYLQWFEKLAHRAGSWYQKLQKQIWRCQIRANLVLQGNTKKIREPLSKAVKKKAIRMQTCFLDQPDDLPWKRTSWSTNQTTFTEKYFLINQTTFTEKYFLINQTTFTEKYFLINQATFTEKYFLINQTTFTVLPSHQTPPALHWPRVWEIATQNASKVAFRSLAFVMPIFIHLAIVYEVGVYHVLFFMGISNIEIDLFHDCLF